MRIVLLLIPCFILAWFAVPAFNLDIGPGFRYESISWRLDLWKDALVLIQYRPFFGYGTNTFMDLFRFINEDARFHPTHLHNSYLQLTVENGIIACGVLLVMFWKLIWTLAGMTRENIAWFMPMAFLNGCVAFLVHSIFENNFFSLQPSIAFWFIAGLSMAFYRIGIKEGIA